MGLNGNLSKFEFRNIKDQVDFRLIVESYLVVIISALVGGLGFTCGSWLSPRVKTLKQDIKYLEGKYHRLRQEVKDNKEEKGFDLSSLLGGGGLQDIIKLVQDNPDIIKNFLGGLGQNKGNSNGFDLDKLR